MAENDGRMKQSALVRETAWSPDRVSRRLKNLETAGWVRRAQQGRENIIFLPRTDYAEAE